MSLVYNVTVFSAQDNEKNIIGSFISKNDAFEAALKAAKSFRDEENKNAYDEYHLNGYDSDDENGIDDEEKLKIWIEKRKNGYDNTKPEFIDYNSEKPFNIVKRNEGFDVIELYEIFTNDPAHYRIRVEETKLK
jgi:hypothetical protein